ncbi:MAG: hypothetical protein NWR67_07255, partial [Saprospiraceae bacterium]|nr:hypothetical protein [Saprospiraceae bacterium]
RKGERSQALKGCNTIPFGIMEFMVRSAGSYFPHEKLLCTLRHGLASRALPFSILVQIHQKVVDIHWKNLRVLEGDQLKIKKFKNLAGGVTFWQLGELTGVI